MGIEVCGRRHNLEIKMENIIKLEESPVILLGDTHCIDGRFQRVLENLSEITLIHLGDAGWGFDNWEEETKNLEKILEICEKNSIDLFFVKGNHENPSYYVRTTKQGNVTWLSDYSILQMNDGRMIQVCGGAHSLDRRQRVPGRDWWEGEELHLDLERVIECDILLSHTTIGYLFGFPPDKGAVLNWARHDPLLIPDLIREQENMRLIFRKAKPKKAFCGHYHVSRRTMIDDCEARILDIFELVELK